MRPVTHSGLDPRQVRGVRIRVKLLALAFVPALGLLAARAFKLQVLERSKMQSMAEEQYLEEAQIPPRRGAIYDRNGVPLAASLDVDSISVDPSVLPGPQAAASLARALKLDPRELGKRLARGHHFAWIRRGASPAEVGAVKALGLPGVGFVKEPRRFYPQRDLAANLLGFAGVDGEGLEGVELAYNEVLKGKPGSVDLIRDAQRRSVFADGLADTDELAGAAVTLTIDRNIQHIAEVALASAAQKTQCTGAMAVVLDPQTGEVLALASQPTFNPNDPSKAPKAAVRDRSVTDAFEPGSTFKAFMMAAALEEKVVRPTDAIFCENGHYAIGNRTIHDHEPYGTLTAAQVIQVSSNIGAAKIAEKLGRDRLNAYYKLFGFGERTGVGLPGEARGQIPYPRADIRLATQAFGQGLTATALQLAAGYAALANGGTLMRPFVVRKVVDPDGALLESHGPEPVRQVVSARTAQELTAMLERVVTQDGTAPKAAMDDYQVAGKTGTAQKVDPEGGGYSADRRIASFIGFVPADHPQLVIAVIIDEPKGDKYGGQVAAPAFKEIAGQALPQLGVPPAHHLPLVAAADPTPKAAPAGAAGGEMPAEGEVEPTPAPGQAVVPDLTGLGARSIARALAQADLEPLLTGSGRAASQRPGAGSVVPRGTKVSVKLESRL